MTITIDLEAGVEAQLREKAAREGQKAEAVAARVLAEILAWEDQERARVIEGVRRGLDDSAAGRTTPLKEWDDRMRVKHDIPSDAKPLTNAEAVLLP